MSSRRIGASMGNWTALIAFSLLSPMGYLLFGYLNRFQKLAVAGIVVNLVIAMGTVAVGPHSCSTRS